MLKYCKQFINTTTENFSKDFSWVFFSIKIVGRIWSAMKIIQHAFLQTLFYQPKYIK